MPDFGALKKVEFQTLAAALRAGKLTFPVSGLSLQRYVGPQRAEALAVQFASLEASGFAPEQAAVLLDTLGQAQGQGGGRPLELVVTGPDAPGISLRDTAVVVRDLFAKARQEVLVVGYAVYKGREVFQALAANMDANPDLQVTLCLDVRREPKDGPAASDVLLRFSRDFVQKEWPGKRVPEVYFDPRSLVEDRAKRAALHAKCVVVDGATAFISSANFTMAAQERNIEVGVLLDGPADAAAIRGYFLKLIETDGLRKVI
jgi:phosphatidylserine/phosphatidylglycerophosphate/cardiolipin synthase-like enzyme